MLSPIITFNGPIGSDEVFGALCKLTDSQFNQLAKELQNEINLVYFANCIVPLMTVLFRETVETL